MEENLLLDAIERYRNNEMTEQEKVFFEELRKNNPDIDQKVAEHSFFLNELERMSEIKSLKHNLDKVESKLLSDGFFTGRPEKTKSKVINCA